MPQVWLIGEPSDLRALLGYGGVDQRSQEGNPAPEAVKRIPSVLDMLVTGGRKANCQETVSEQETAELRGLGVVRGDSSSVAKTVLGTKRVPSVLDMLVACGNGEGTPSCDNCKGSSSGGSSGSPGKSEGECAEVRETFEPATPQCIADPSESDGECAKVRVAIEPATSQRIASGTGRSDGKPQGKCSGTSGGLNCEGEPGQAGGESDGHRKHAKTQGPGLLKTLAGTGLQANPSGGWSRAEPHKRADIGSDGEADTSSDDLGGESSDGDLQWIEKLVIEHEQLKKQIRDLGDDLQEREPPLPSRQTRSREFKAKKRGGLEVVEAKGKKNKGGKTGQQRAPR